MIGTKESKVEDREQWDFRRGLDKIRERVRGKAGRCPEVPGASSVSFPKGNPFWNRGQYAEV